MLWKALKTGLYVAFLIIFLSGFLAQAPAGPNKGGTGIPISLINTEEYVFKVDVASDTGGVINTIPPADEVVAVPIGMYATDTTGAGAGLSIYEFQNVIYYDPEELTYNGYGSEVWNTDSMDVTDSPHGDLRKVNIHALGDTVDCGNGEWEDFYYLEFTIDCVDHDEIELDLWFDVETSENWTKAVGSSSIEDYDDFSDGFAYVIAYRAYESVDSVETLFGEDTVEVNVYMDSANYRFYAIKNQIHFDSAYFDFVGITMGGLTEYWSFGYGTEQGDTASVVIANIDGYAGPVDTPSLIYTLKFTPKYTSDSIICPLAITEGDSNFVAPYDCIDFWEDCHLGLEDGIIVVPPYRFYGKLEFPAEGEPGDTITMGVKVKGNFPAGLYDTGDIQMLIKHDARLNYFNDYDNVYDSVYLCVTRINDSLIGINLNMPNGKPGYVPPLDEFVTYCELEMEIDAGATYEFEEGLVALFDESYGVHYATRAVDTTGNDTCDLINEKFVDTPDTLTILCANIYANDVSGSSNVYQPFYIDHDFELDSIYFEINYNKDAICKMSSASASGITVSTVDNNTVSVHGSNLNFAADDNTWLVTIRWGAKVGGKNSSTADIANSEVYDGNGDQRYAAETDATVSTNLPVWQTSPCPIGTPKKETAVPDRFTLYQNHPNPFNPLTIISFDLPQASYVNLNVYNILGQKVSGLVDDYLDAGHYDIEWNTSKHSDLSSGVYFYMIRAGDYEDSRKMMLIK